MRRHSSVSSQPGGAATAPASTLENPPQSSRTVQRKDMLAAMKLRTGTLPAGIPW